MTGLPADLADALHLIEPFAWRRALLVAAVVALVLLTLVLMWRRVRRARRPVPMPPAAPTAPAPAATGLDAAVADLRERILRIGLFREGCHALARLLRVHFEAAHQRPYSTLTAAEIGRLVGERPLTRLLSLLAELQFGRRAPSRADFEGACELAVDVSRSAAARGRR